MGQDYKGMHINDAVFPFKPMSTFIPWTSFMSIGNIALDGNAANIWISQGSGTTAGTPLVGEMGATSTDIATIEIAAAGDLISTYWPFPQHFNTADPEVYFRVHFIHEATDADTPDFKIHTSGEQPRRRLQSRWRERQQYQPSPITPAQQPLIALKSVIGCLLVHSQHQQTLQGYLPWKQTISVLLQQVKSC